MRETERDPLRIEHMLTAAERIKKFMVEKDLSDIQNDEILFYAIVKI